MLIALSSVLKSLYSNDNMGAEFIYWDCDSRIWAAWRLGKLNYHDYSTLLGRLNAAHRLKRGSAMCQWVNDFIVNNDLKPASVLDILCLPKREKRELGR